MNIVAGIDKLNLVIENLKKSINNKNIVVMLRGTLASGKTTLVREYIKSIGLKDVVTSPTFCLQNIYGQNIYHYDMYNKTIDEFISLGLLEEFEKDGVHFVEWGNKKLETVLEEYGFEVLIVNIKKVKNKREYIIGS